METDRIKLKMFCISIALVLLAESLAGLMISKKNGNLMLILGGVRLFEIIILLVIFQAREKQLSAIGLGKDQIMPGLKKGMVWSFGFGVLVCIGFAVLFNMNMNPLKMLKVRLPQMPLECAIFFLAGGLIGPVAEEIFFRGILYGFFRRWGVFPALFLSTSMFVMLHSAFGITQITGGLLFAAAYEIEGKLMTPITVHVTGNLALFTLSLVSLKIL